MLLVTTLVASIYTTIYFIHHTRIELVRSTIESNQSIVLATLQSNIENDIRFGLIDDAIFKFNTIAKRFSHAFDCIQLMTPEKIIVADSPSCDSNMVVKEKIMRSTMIEVHQDGPVGFKISVWTDPKKMIDRLPNAFLGLYVAYAVIFLLLALVLTFLSTSVFSEILSIIEGNEVKNKVVSKFAEVREVLKLVRQQDFLKAEIMQLNLQSAKNDAIKTMAVQVSHDIRSPLSAIETVISMITLDSKYANLLRQSSQVIRGIADNLLSDSSSRPILSSIVSSEIVEVIDNLVKLIQISHSSFNVSINTYYSQPINARYTISKSDLHRCLDNLIRNSIHASLERKKVLVKVQVLFKVDQVHIIVEDDGPGFPSDRKLNLKNNKMQHEIIGNTKAGYGIGLQSVRRIAEQSNGSFHIDHEFKIGAKIILIFPATMR